MDGGSTPPASIWETNMRLFLEVTKSFWQQLAEDAIKRGVATLVTEGVKSGIEVCREAYKGKQIKKEDPPPVEKKCLKCKCKKDEDS